MSARSAAGRRAAGGGAAGRDSRAGDHSPGGGDRLPDLFRASRGPEPDATSGAGSTACRWWPGRVDAGCRRTLSAVVPPPARLRRVGAVAPEGWRGSRQSSCAAQPTTQQPAQGRLAELASEQRIKLVVGQTPARQGRPPAPQDRRQTSEQVAVAQQRAPGATVGDEKVPLAPEEAKRSVAARGAQGGCAGSSPPGWRSSGARILPWKGRLLHPDAGLEQWARTDRRIPRAERAVRGRRPPGSCRSSHRSDRSRPTSAAGKGRHRHKRRAPFPAAPIRLTDRRDLASRPIHSG